jgi:cell division initiation protein
MALTPAEIRHVPLKRGLFGYRRADIDDLLDEVVDSFTACWQERVDLRDRIDELEAEVRKTREMEDLLRRTLISAEKNAADQKEAARREAQQIIREAEQEAREILGEAHHQRAAVWRDTQGIEQKGRELAARYRMFLQTAEAVLDEMGEADEEHTEEREAFREEITLH